MKDGSDIDKVVRPFGLEQSQEVLWSLADFGNLEYDCILQTIRFDGLLMMAIP